MNHEASNAQAGRLLPGAIGSPFFILVHWMAGTSQILC